MADFLTISKDLQQMLDLKYEAVGVTLYREGEPCRRGWNLRRKI